MELLDSSMNECTILEADCSTCDHSFVEDYIDLDYGEKSVKIRYCEKCLCTLCAIDLPITTHGVSTTSR